MTKKPDFLRDLDTAIMDELTGGGIKGNAAGLVGTLTQIKEIKQLCGLPFCGYMAKLETVRPSGAPDEVTVVFAEDVPYRACNGIEFDVMQEFVEGSRLLLTGKVQTLKDFQSGRLLVYILADFVAVSEKAVEQDEAAVRGVIANKPTYRETPRGNSCAGIDGAIRKVGMLISLVFMLAIDVLIKINLIGFIPEQARTYLGLDTVGVAEFFALLYIAYEVVSIFKNMALCGLPVKKVWEKVREFLAKYTDELPDTDELDGDSTTGNVEEHRTQER